MRSVRASSVNREKEKLREEDFQNHFTGVRSKTRDVVGDSRERRERTVRSMSIICRRVRY